jgi:hypothetical protein
MCAPGESIKTINKGCVHERTTHQCGTFLSLHVQRMGNLGEMIFSMDADIKFADEFELLLLHPLHF